MGTEKNENHIFNTAFKVLLSLNFESLRFAALLSVATLFLTLLTLGGEKLCWLSYNTTSNIWGTILDSNTLILNLSIAMLAYLFAIILKVWDIKLLSNLTSFNALIPALLGFIYFVWVMTMLVNPFFAWLTSSPLSLMKTLQLMGQIFILVALYNLVLFICIIPFIKRETAIKRSFSCKILFSFFITIAILGLVFSIIKFWFTFSPTP